MILKPLTWRVLTFFARWLAAKADYKVALAVPGQQIWCAKICTIISHLNGSLTYYLLHHNLCEPSQSQSAYKLQTRWQLETDRLA